MIQISLEIVEAIIALCRARKLLHLGLLALRRVPLIVLLLQIKTHARFGSENAEAAQCGAASRPAIEATGGISVSI
jgi:hypothetical protein